jgi:phage-related protein
VGAPGFGVRFYRNPSGEEPARIWLQGLPKRVRAEIGADLFFVQEYWPTGMPRVGSIGRGLHELRSTFDGNEYRVFFCVRDGMIVVLHGFQKKTRKPPAGDLAIARTRQKEVER